MISTKSGFSLIEILVTLAIIASLTGLGVYLYTDQKYSSEEKMAANFAKHLVTTINAHIGLNGFKPRDISQTLCYVLVPTSRQEDKPAALYSSNCEVCPKKALIYYYPDGINVSSSKTTNLFNYRIGINNCTLTISSCYEESKEKVKFYLESPNTLECLNRITSSTSDLNKNIAQFKLLAGVE